MNKRHWSRSTTHLATSRSHIFLTKNRGWIMILQVWSALDNISIHQFHLLLIKCLVDWRCLKIACSCELHTSFVRKPPSGSKYFTSAASINHQARQASLQPSDSHGTLRASIFRCPAGFTLLKASGHCPWHTSSQTGTALCRFDCLWSDLEQPGA